MAKEQDEYYGFTPEARQSIRNVRSGKALAGKAVRGSAKEAEKASAQAGGPLPVEMYKQARKGKMVRKQNG
jgi:hypothetical protein